MIKAIFIDIDGTLCDSKKNVSTRTINAIKEITKKGVLVILCSGRPRKYTEAISKKCHASKYIINSTGANIYDYVEKTSLYSNPINKDAIIKLYYLAQKEDIRLVFDGIDNRKVTKIKNPNEETNLLVESIEDFVKFNDVFQCIITDEKKETFTRIIPEIQKIDGIEIKNRHKSLIDSNFKNNNVLFIDIGSIGTNKGIAIKKLINILQINKEETVAIGDDINDLLMFEHVGYKVAMGNALDKVKEEADEVVPSNDEDGVAVYLEKIINMED